MKNHIQSKVYWWVAALILAVILNHCASPARKQEAPPSPPPQAAPAPKETLPPPKEPIPPSKEAGPSPTKAPPPSAGPSAPAPETAAPPEETYFTHTVKWYGETLFIIAAWYTGDRENWKILAEVMALKNPSANIHRISSGNKIFIPESVMKTKDPMPKEFVESFYPKTKVEKPAAKPAPSKEKEEEEPQLFGPKEIPKK
jgi:hypothetical protein